MIALETAVCSALKAGSQMNPLARIFRLFHQTNVEPCVVRLLVKRRSGRKACVIEIRNDQSFTDLDLAIRNALGYSGWDHCSAFFKGVPWESKCLVEVYPDNSARGQLRPISSIPLAPGMELGYTYDFGDDRQHFIIVEDLLPIDSTIDYPICTTVKATHKQTKKRRSNKRRNPRLTPDS